MKITVSKKYMTLPINTDRALKSILFFENDTLIYDMSCRIDTIDPKFTAYVDVERYIGKTIEIIIDPYIDCDIGFTDKMELPMLYHETLRPQIHFTVPNGYSGDPNGLIYYDGTYHLFYQYAPVTNATSNPNMHWGHASSTDLLHWQNHDCALFPDEMGAMFSGSAIEDVNNITGLSKNGKTPFLLYYTAAGDKLRISQGKKRTQCMAYSTDGGKTFTKYEKNPVVEHIKGLNRDPKVVWVEEINKFVMVIYHDYFEFLSSDDLINWTRLNEISIGKDRECPDIYQINCNGKKKWVVSGASDYYVLGHFTDSAFVPETEPKKLTCGGTYATQSFSGINDGRVIRLWWEKNKNKKIDARFSQQMGIPTEVTLNEIDGEYYLSALPVREIETLYKSTVSIKNHTLTQSISHQLMEEALDISIKAPYEENGEIHLTVFGRKIVLNTAANTAGIPDEYVSMPLSLKKDVIDVRIIIDACSIEFYSDGGKYCMSFDAPWDLNLPYIELSSPQTAEIHDFTYHTLHSIH